jgi:hypothetical protein
LRRRLPGPVPPQAPYRLDMKSADAREATHRPARWAALMAVSLVLGFVAACSGERGESEADGTAAGASESAAATPEATSPPAVITFEDLVADPCSAVSEDEAVEFGYVVGTAEAGEAPSCGWETGQVYLNLTLFPSTDAATRAAEWEQGNVTDVVIDGIRAIQSEYQAICFVNIAVGTNHSLEVKAIGDHTIQDQLCPAAVDLTTVALQKIQ